MGIAGSVGMVRDFVAVALVGGIVAAVAFAVALAIAG